MKSAAFNYQRPETLQSALQLLADAPGTTSPIAGGQSLLPLLGLRMASVEALMDIGRLADLRQVSATPTHVTIGAAITPAEIEDGKLDDPARGLMQRMASQIAYRAIRNQGTIGGSVAMADPAADWPACLIALNAVAIIASSRGTRTCHVSELIVDTYTTTLASDELILGFRVPRLHSSAKTAVSKVARKAGAFAMSLAVVVLDDGDERARIVLAGAGGRAVRLPASCTALHDRINEAGLADALSADLASLCGGDAYSIRLHRANALRAIEEARAQ